MASMTAAVGTRRRPKASHGWAPTLSMRLLVSQALIIVTMGITLLGVGAVVGPAEFRRDDARLGPRSLQVRHLLTGRTQTYTAQ